MCGRFTLRTSGKVLAELFQLPEVPQLPLRYNIAPTQPVAAVRQAAGSGTRPGANPGPWSSTWATTLSLPTW